MARFTAGPRPAVATCKAHVRSSDVLVAIIAYRCGWLPTPEEGGTGDKSITFLEIEEALSHDIPVFVFLANEPALRAHSDTSPEDGDGYLVRHEALSRLKRALDKSHVQRSFSSKEDLGAQVISSLYWYETREEVWSEGDWQGAHDQALEGMERASGNDFKLARMDLRIAWARSLVELDQPRRALDEAHSLREEIEGDDFGYRWALPETLDVAAMASRKLNSPDADGLRTRATRVRNDLSKPISVIDSRSMG